MLLQLTLMATCILKRLTISVWTLLHCSSLKKRWCSDIISLLKGMKLWPSPLYSMFVFSTYWHVAMVKIRSQAFPPALLFMLLLLLYKILNYFFPFSFAYRLVHNLLLQQLIQGVGHSVYKQLYYAWQLNIANPTIRCQKKTKINDNSHLYFFFNLNVPNISN